MLRQQMLSSQASQRLSQKISHQQLVCKVWAWHLQQLLPQVMQQLQLMAAKLPMQKVLLPIKVKQHQCL